MKRARRLRTTIQRPKALRNVLITLCAGPRCTCVFSSSRVSNENLGSPDCHSARRMCPARRGTGLGQYPCAWPDPGRTSCAPLRAHARAARRTGLGARSLAVERTRLRLALRLLASGSARPRVRTGPMGPGRRWLAMDGGQLAARGATAPRRARRPWRWWSPLPTGTGQEGPLLIPSGEMYGAACRNRTDDLPLTRRVLYQLS